MGNNIEEKVTSRFTIYVGCFLLIAGIGLLDYLERWEICFSIFYILPIFIGTWYLGKRAGILLAVVCAVAWYLADFMVAESYLHPMVPYWNSSVRLVFFIITVMLVSNRHKELEKEREMARIDSLSGLLNNGSFSEVAQKEIERSRRYGHPLSIIFLDFDDFKSVNDTYGHVLGDKVIKDVGSVIKENIRSTDYASRTGGDEFVLLLPETAAAEAEAYIKRVQKKMKESIILNGNPATFSIGLASFDLPPETTEELIKQADKLMYKAKQAGKDRVVIETAITSEKS